MKPAQETFLMSEFEKLGKEITETMTEIHKREKFSVTILGVIAAWVLTEHAKPGEGSSGILICIAAIPILTTGFYAVSVYYLYKGIGVRGRYLKHIEKSILTPDEENSDPKKFGWESFFEGRIKIEEDTRPIIDNHKIADVNVAFGLSATQLILGIVLFAIFVAFNAHGHC